MPFVSRCIIDTAIFHLRSILWISTMTIAAKKKAYQLWHSISTGLVVSTRYLKINVLATNPFIMSPPELHFWPFPQSFFFFYLFFFFSLFWLFVLGSKFFLSFLSSLHHPVSLLFLVKLEEKIIWLFFGIMPVWILRHHSNSAIRQFITTIHLYIHTFFFHLSNLLLVL